MTKTINSEGIKRKMYRNGQVAKKRKYKNLGGNV